MGKWVLGILRGYRVVGAGCVSAQVKATTRVAPTNGVNPLNSPRASLVTQSSKNKFHPGLIGFRKPIRSKPGSYF